MRTSLIAAASLALCLTGCSKPADGGGTESEFGFHEAQQSSVFNLLEGDSDMAMVERVQSLSVEEPPADTASSVPLPTAATASAPNQIAYSYGYGFRIEADAIAKLQERHVALCEKMAPACRIIRTSQSRSDSWDGYGEVSMEVAADRAGKLGEALLAPAEELGGTLVSSVREGEDLSTQIIDTEARLKSRLLLRDKLTAILQNNRGSVDELVKAESEVAKVNEEIDAVRARLESFRGRIRYSDVKIQYEPAFGESQVGFVRPVATALRSVGSTLGVSIAAIVYAVTALLPLVLLIAGLRWVLHRFGFRLRFWKNDLRKTKAAEEPAES
ncbi:DUF4349 domain-containing protein [Erythrobacter colymbi]|uniref:DUF4349 domain-containing protein n=1 Tax=Erythrobacter colymbi TaxID=1161202 RepID=UPI000A3CD273|nr:DUF4349 domain-containing protein [Erythrobacter colymbi]